MFRRTAVWAAALGSAAVVTLAVPVASQAARQTYSSPGYRWDGKLPKVAPTIPGKLISIGDGADPHVLVDAAGTAQVAYTTQPDLQPSVLHDCVLQRGQTACAANQGLIPPATTPEYSTDDDGPTPLALGNELLMLDYRYPDLETLPDGTTGYPTFLWTSEDGGKSFTGPGDIGQTGVSGNAVVSGGANPQISWITDTVTGGTFFSSAPAGTYQPARLNLGDQGPDEAYNGRLALDGDRPVAEFTDLTNHVFIREWNGTGDIMNAANWSVVRLNGTGYARLVGGPSGVYLLYQKTSEGGLYVQRIVNGQPSGPASQVVSKNDYEHVFYAIDEDSSGRLTVGWVSSSTNPEIEVSSSTDGSHWSVPQVIARHFGQPSQLSIAAAQDGGGFAAFQVQAQGSPSQYKIDVASFGSFAATGQQGLGNLDGTGLGGLGGDPDASASCSDVHFGDIDAITQGNGCFLRDPTDPTSGAAISEGPIRLNGLQIIPDAGAKIVIDPRQHTINTTGSVSVVLRAPGIGDITLYHGELHVSLSGSLDLSGQDLFDFDTSKFTSSLEGFPFDGKIDVKIAHDAVVIPVSLKLPEYMGGITGSAVLKADNANGFDLQSLNISADEIVLGALEIKDLAIGYTETGNVWTGKATLDIPAGSPYFGVGVNVEFDDGDFTMGSFQVGPVYPGIPIFTDTYINGFGGGFDIHPGHKTFFGSIDIGAIPLDPPNYTLGVDGKVSITFEDSGPVILTVSGSAAVHGLQVATAALTFESTGYFHLTGQADLDLDVVDISAKIDAFADLPAKEFSSEITGDLDIAGIDVSGIDGIVSSKGAGACGSYLGLQAGFGYAWGGAVHVFWHGCDFGPYRVQPISAVPSVSGARAVSSDVAVGAGTPVTNLEVHGTGGAPSVVLTDPAGHTVTPVALSPQTVRSPAISIADPAHDVTYVSVTSPKSGNWQVAAAAGSAPIAHVLAARGYPAPKLSAKVSGTGRTRTLVYHVKAPPGTTVQYAERGKGAYRLIGTAKGASGHIRFAPAAGPAGRREIVATLTENGLPARSMTLAHYTAPKPPPPGRVKGLRVARRGQTFRVAFGGAPAADHYLLRIVATDGHRYARVISGKAAHRVTVPALGYQDAVTATVTAISSMQRSGPAVSAKASYTSKVLARAQRQAKPRTTHHHHKAKRKKKKRQR